MSKGFKLVLGAVLLAAITFPAAVSAKPEAKPEASIMKTKAMFAAKPEAKPEVT
ncbi:hypothetical protein [Paenibacillus sp. UNC451MF]|uniref:hypothetical protein n=1 Tax=Paenibacillus sp. UNC451MF TaxID=1449063 RepID=UPI000A5CA882|nr:hypothetical protein [Paenibacillus sp. UNC451MF]